MSRKDWQENTIDKLFPKLYPKDVCSILDVGCGLSFKAQYLPAIVRVALDAHKPFLDAIDAQCSYIPVKLNAVQIGDVFSEKSFDVVLLLDVLEHIEHNDTFTVLDAAERIAKKAVVIETPLGFVHQDIDIWNKGGDYWQTHRSAWSTASFSIRGYTVKTRPYMMTDAKRYSGGDVKRDITLIDAIKVFK